MSAEPPPVEFLDCCGGELISEMALINIVSPLIAANNKTKKGSWGFGVLHRGEFYHLCKFGSLGIRGSRDFEIVSLLLEMLHHIIMLSTPWFSSS